MIEEITFKFGPKGTSQTLAVPAKNGVIVVGPNNSGKSLALREIWSFCNSGRIHNKAKIIQEVRLGALSQSDASEVLSRHRVEPKGGENVPEGHAIIAYEGDRMLIPIARYLQSLQDANQHTQMFCEKFLRHKSKLLSGPNRIALTNRQPSGTPTEPKNALQTLLGDDDKRYEVRRIIHEAFGKYFCLNLTTPSEIHITLSEVEPADPILERSFTEDAVNFHKSTDPISNYSEGVQAFTGIIMEAIAGDPMVFLIDEPEAFLHPTLSRMLGKELASSIMATKKKLFAATHSPNFLMGCINSGVEINILRLTYAEGSPTARILPHSELQHLMRDPMLRSTNALSGLFYEAVLITEGDSDRAFYEVVNERMLGHGENVSGIKDCLFLNAHNKQTIWRILAPLRKMGIAAATVVDIDIVKEGGSVWTNLLCAAGVPANVIQSLAGLRSSVNNHFSKLTDKEMKRDGGIKLLTDDQQEEAVHLFNSLASYGIFVVADGELESWLQCAPGINRSKSNFLNDAFDYLGTESKDETFIKPNNTDVWKFMDEIRTWVENNR